MKTLIGTPGHDTKSLFKRCGCVNPATGRRSGARCPHLADPGHGTWYFTVELTQQCGSRQRLAAADTPPAPSPHCPRRSPGPTDRACRQQGMDCTALAAPMADRHQPVPAAHTVHGYTAHAHLYLAPHLGHVILAELTTRQVQNMLRALAERTGQMKTLTNSPRGCPRCP